MHSGKFSLLVSISPANNIGILNYRILLAVNNLHTQDGVKSHDMINGDIFFEIIEPQELEYTYRLKPAKDFGTTFTTDFFIQQR